MSDSPTLVSLLAANERFYRTFERLDYPALAALWEESDRVFCVHPGWGPLRGARSVLESWQRIIENTKQIRFNLSHEQAHISGKGPDTEGADPEGADPEGGDSRNLVGTVTCFEVIQNEADSQRDTSGAISTNLFAFDAGTGMWKIFHHHASHTLIPESEDDGMLLV